MCQIRQGTIVYIFDMFYCFIGPHNVQHVQDLGSGGVWLYICFLL
jgi:hypothetical protein